ncbi:hypothetical protein CEUSTIGMA_g3135.t1 [Chlamydomonas eustigma]|uniref:glutathione gamma-glutamylcysteinyltransferase n=1 Tax=Chlamydomonas eustigma TaxID=1157962 RepID=A0A250WYK7_9CHLO|nr:hypothetical protein CEUSTIGMA_g3135.t1 [Chlamydomonas eustigma]|eukprot:GAX75692.1 hypothetical protein CEUSTIGMA_g3135.t1 [Chlamydomonas eustigma]
MLNVRTAKFCCGYLKSFSGLKSSAITPSNFEKRHSTISFSGTSSLKGIEYNSATLSPMNETVPEMTCSTQKSSCTSRVEHVCGEPPSLKNPFSIHLYSISGAGSVQPSQSTATPIVGVTALQTGSGFRRTFYKRHLPSPPAIAFSSPQGRQIFQEALMGGTLGGFFKLMEQFSMQDEPAFCGLTSLTMVLNALSIDPRRTWKGSWRWFHEAMLDCCRPLESVKEDGITLAQAACLARCNGARVDMMRHGTFSEAEFRQQVMDVCRSGEEHLVVSYARRAFSQTGDGHFSPVGGYHEGQDLVLILDVARFKYPPHWVPLPLLYEAMSHIDPTTGLPRGYMLLSAHPLLDSAMFTLDIRQDGWKLARSYATMMPVVLEQYMSLRAQRLQQEQQMLTAKEDKLVVMEHAVRHLVLGIPKQGIISFIAIRELARAPGEKCVPQKSRETLLVELRAMVLYQLVLKAIKGDGPSALAAAGGEAGMRSPEDTEDMGGSLCSSSACMADRCTLLIMLQPPSAWPAWSSPELNTQWQALLDLTNFSVVATEVAYMRQQFVHVDEVMQGDSVDATCGQPACTSRLDCAVLGH